MMQTMTAHLGDKVPETSQESIDLRLDGCSHAVPRYEVDILPLVLLRHPAANIHIHNESLEPSGGEKSTWCS